MTPTPEHNAPDTIWAWHDQPIGRDKWPEFGWGVMPDQNRVTVQYTRTATIPTWQDISTTKPAMDGRWIVFADMDGEGVIRLAHVDCAVVEMGVWYIGVDLSIWTHWRYLEPVAPTEGADT